MLYYESVFKTLNQQICQLFGYLFDADII